MRFSKHKAYLNIFVFTALVIEFIVHWIAILKTSVNIPYWDEWEILNPLSLNTSLSISWLWRQHYDHRIVITKIYTWLLYKINGWDLVFNLGLNFFVFGGVVLLLVQAWKFFKEEIPFWVFGLFLIFVLSPLPAESHSWAFESQYHFVIIFNFLQILYLYSDRPRGFLISLIFGVLAILTLASGIISSAIIYSIFTLSQLGNIKQSLKKIFVIVTVHAALVGFWFYNYTVPHNLPQKTSPLKIKVWDFFMNLISYGFGYETVSWVLGLFCLILVLLPLVRFRSFKNRELTLLSFLTIVLGSLFVTAIGRTSWGLDTSKTSRYAEFSSLLLPLTALSISMNFKRLKTPLLALLFITAFLGYFDNWNFDRYRATQTQYQKGYDCVQDYYRSKGKPQCPSISGFEDLTPHLELARKLGLSFFRDSLKQHHEQH